MTEADWGPGRRVLLPDPSETGQGAPAGIYTGGGWMSMYLAAKSAMAFFTRSRCV